MNVSLTIALHSNRPGCPPISCGKDGIVAFQLREESIPKGRDGSGWLIGTITAAPYPMAQIGATDWVYQIEFLESELSAALVAGDLPALAASDMATGTGATGICCLSCGSIMLIDKINSIRLRDLQRETFRVFSYNEAHTAGIQRLGFRNHSPIRIYAMEAAVDSHAEGAQPIEIQLARSPAHQSSPHAAFTASSLSISPASVTPLTGRIEFATPIEVEAGASVAVNLIESDAAAHSGLIIHLEYRVV